MDTEIMLRMLMDASVDEEVRRLCDCLPEYRQSRDELDRWYKKAEEALGYKVFCQMEAAINRCYSWEATAYYALGLRLREELARALMLL